MITINLLPPEARRAAVRSQWADLPWPKIGAAALGVVLLHSVWVLGWGQLQARALGRLTAEWEALQPDKVRVERTQEVLAALQRRAAAVQALKDSQNQWAPRLNLLSDALVAGLWFTQLRFGPVAAPEGQPTEMTESGGPPPPGPPVLWLAGSALVLPEGEDAPPKRYLQRLQAQPEFSRWFLGVELKGIEHRQAGAESVSDFGFVMTVTGMDAARG